ncbi:TetR/AcrR family transcriptional regulator [Streptomyces litchfieldiae]|uniref:Helix-turn-helix domain-containing protein n=1 Tax=Streptomyces litchfieldiae TaxID=3075543 RepID=A0ABU2MRL3_9ACTN|nr:helix-turn-helix domain-containing protein [Streptomyces sp. DSM 44938]MDT0344116.1 helix-turn-helix domain-containing protein [Streptomyces sp. DSM 44938]
MSETAGARPMRADARRNKERLLAEARVAFAARGTGASLEDIAGRCGLGIGTLYRHFPTRQALLEAVLFEQFSALAVSGRDLLHHRSAREALITWTRAFVSTTTTYRGLTATLTATLRDRTSELHASCEAMRDAGAGLLARAQRAGGIRPDIEATEFLTLISGIAWAHEQATSTDHPGQLDRLLGMVFDGLTPTGNGHSSPGKSS